jgi:hypothetical protein
MAVFNVAGPNDRVGRVSDSATGNSLSAIDRKGNHIAKLLCAQGQHHQTVNAQRHAGAIRQTGF